MRRMRRWYESQNAHLEQSGQLRFSAAQARDLASQLAGRITLPQDSSYNLDRETFVNTFQHFPQIIIHCQAFSDVVQAIRFAKRVGLRPVCRAGGHSTAGYSVNDDMVIDVSAINYVRVDQALGSAWVGAGTQFAHLNAALDLYDLHIPTGGCETVAVGGYMQGGGYGFTSLMFGMNCDLVTSIQMALGDGSIVMANSKANSDLFWAVRGGTGNNFGVLLEITYELRKLKDLQGFGFRWPISTPAEVGIAAQALFAWQSHFAGMPDPQKFGAEAALVYTRKFGEETGEHPLVPHFVIRGMFDGVEEDCRRLLDPLFAIGAQKFQDVWRRGTYLDLNRFLLAFPTELPSNVPPSARMLAKSHIVGRHLYLDECASLIELYRQTPSINNFIAFEPYGGAVNTVAPTETAFWHRRAVMDVFAFFFWLGEDERKNAEMYVDKFDAVAGRLSNGHSYQNYPNRNNKNFGSLYFGENLQRLIKIKRHYDPEDFFTFQQGLLQARIPPSSNCQDLLRT